MTELPCLHHIAEYERAPSDAGLEAILERFPNDWNPLSIAMGVRIGTVRAGKSDHDGKLKALQEWRDGKIDRHHLHPGTWEYFLKTVRGKLGHLPADKFKRKLDENFEAWTDCKPGE